jgi:hypothetical protein
VGEGTTLGDMLVQPLRTHGPMLSVCPVEGCTSLTMGGTCVVHDPPATIVYERGRPFVSTAPAASDRVTVAG